MSDIEILWGPIRSILRERCTAYRLKQIVSLTGVDVTRLTGIPLTSNPSDKDKLVEGVESLYVGLDEPARAQFLRIVTEELLREKPELEDMLESCLNRLGWRLHDKVLIPVQVFDPTELAELPESAHKDLLKAAERFRNGDLDGSMASACAAIDATTTTIWQMEGLGDIGTASFQERVNKAFTALHVYDVLVSELEDIGWEEKDANQLRGNLKGSINQAAYVMQSLRSKMSDVHGTKEVLKPLVFDSIKWATIILRLLTEKSG